MMAGEIKSPGERHFDRMQRQLRRETQDMLQISAFVDRIRRREAGADDLPPMPLDFKRWEEWRKRQGR